MNRITHCLYLPLTIDYWDYYILCGLNIEAARILQRLEFWDGTKGEENHEVASPTVPGIQLARFIWKSEEELCWELMSSCSEKRLAACLQFLINNRQYVISRTNPVRRFDRTKQYAVQVQRIQEHLNKLDALIKTLLEAGRRLRPVQFAIEALIRQGRAIEELTVEQIADQLTALHQLMQQDEERRSEGNHRQNKVGIPTFIRLHLQKDEAQGFCALSSLVKTPTSIPHSDGIETPDLWHRHEQRASLDVCSSTGAIPEKTSENTSTRIQTEHPGRAEAITSSHSHEVVSAAPPVSLRSSDDTDEAQHLDMAAEDIVGVFELKQGKRYDAKMRPVQLTSARTLLTLQLPLTAEIVGHMYDECCDEWWREHYGTLHVSHLVEREHHHGQPRIIRLLQRVQAKAQRTMHAIKQADDNPGAMKQIATRKRKGPECYVWWILLNVWFSMIWAWNVAVGS